MDRENARYNDNSPKKKDSELERYRESERGRNKSMERAINKGTTSEKEQEREKRERQGESETIRKPASNNILLVQCLSNGSLTSETCMYLATTTACLSLDSYKVPQEEYLRKEECFQTYFKHQFDHYSKHRLRKLFLDRSDI